tara:strand:- start:90 stop:356 length:267 start_codon:yes stop_codon:yes gene_type:complete
MIYYLVEKRTDNIVDKIDSVTPGPVKDYFIGRKQMKENEKGFDGIWKVMSQEEYDKEFKNNLYGRQMGKRKYEWWKDEPKGPDDEFDY